jgi:hypothetical protein
MNYSHESEIKQVRNTFMTTQLIAAYDKYLRVQIERLRCRRQERNTALDIQRREGTFAGRQEIR